MAKCSCCGKGGLFQKLNTDKLCLSCVTDKYERLIAETPKEAHDLADIRAELVRKEKEYAEFDSKLWALKSEIRKLEKQAIVVESNLEFESFSLYQPRFKFTTSEEYKNNLDSIRDAEKAMIKAGTATRCSENWTVNGSRSEGKKMTNDMIKLFLRSFNNECDAAVSDAKFSNFDRCKNRIEKSFETINKLGKISHVSITHSYLELKMQELHLAYEYQCKKEEEKERLRELREQQREEAKLQKEIEAARKEAEKEKKHYQQALEKLRAQAEKTSTEEQKKEIAEKQEEILGFLDDLQKKMEDIDYRQNNQRAGYVYIISNIGSFGEGVYKIGMTRRLTPMDRVDELGDASVPFRFDVHAMIFSEDAPKLEAALHQAFDSKRVNRVNTKREYFRVSLDEIKEVVKKNHDKTVEFVDYPDAWQYRESLQIK